jgi:hypothetical protein
VAAHCSTPLRGACDQLAQFLVGGRREIFAKIARLPGKYSGVIAQSGLKSSVDCSEGNLGPAVVVM